MVIYFCKQLLLILTVSSVNVTLSTAIFDLFKTYHTQLWVLVGLFINSSQEIPFGGGWPYPGANNDNLYTKYLYASLFESLLSLCRQN